MSTSQVRLVNVLIALLVGGSLVDIATDREHWPLSNYPMFSGIARDRLSAIVIFGVTDVEPVDQLAVLQVIWKAALLLSCLGLFTRLSTATSFLLGAYLLGLPHNFGKTDHYDAVLVLILSIMACSRCGDSWSAHRLLSASRRRAVERPVSGEYTWPIRLAQVMLSLVFFAAGVAKLRHAGLAWIASDKLYRGLGRPETGTHGRPSAAAPDR